MKRYSRKRLLESSDGTVGSPTEIHPEPLPRMRNRKPTTDMLKRMQSVRVDIYNELKDVLIREIRSDEELERRVYGLVDGWDRSIWPLEIGPLQIILSDEYAKEDLFGIFGRLVNITKRSFSDVLTYSIEQNSNADPQGLLVIETEQKIDGDSYNFQILVDVMIYVRSDVQRLDKTGTAIILWNNGQNDIRGRLPDHSFDLRNSSADLALDE